MNPYQSAMVRFISNQQKQELDLFLKNRSIVHIFNPPQLHAHVRCVDDDPKVFLDRSNQSPSNQPSK